MNQLSDDGNKNGEPDFVSNNGSSNARDFEDSVPHRQHSARNSSVHDIPYEEAKSVVHFADENTAQHTGVPTTILPTLNNSEHHESQEENTPSKDSVSKKPVVVYDPSLSRL